MATIKDLKTNPPTSKRDLTKENMLKFIKNHGSAEDKKWFVDLMNTNKLNKVSNLDGKPVVGYNLGVIREEFARKFFEDLSSKSKKGGKAKKKPSFEDELLSLLD